MLMRLMIRLLFLSQLLIPLRAYAVQIYVENAFVHRKNSNCIVETFNGTPRFRCPPIPNNVFCTASVGSCNVASGAGNAGCGGVCGAPGGQFCGNCQPSVDPTTFGNISNQPNLEFERQDDATVCDGAGLAFPSGTNANNFCNSALFLCGSVGYGNDTSSAVAIDEISYEIFKFADGSNPLDPASSPPLRTFFIDAPGVIPAATNSSASGPLGPFCVLFDGSFNIQGEFGKSNGQYGFRVTVKTNQVGSSGNIQITAVRAYPSGATRDNLGNVVSQKPVIEDVTDVHVIRSSPTLVGAITPVAAEPYNLSYRLSKDATMYININDSSPPFARLRTVLSGNARVGEGIPQGTLTNGDSWNGRADNGDLLPPGVYLANFQAVVADGFGRDLSEATTRQVGLDPLQITDIRVSPLLEGATSLAVLSYLLSEPATTYVDIYSPGTQFCNIAGIGDPLNQVNNPALDQASPLPPKDFRPRVDCAGANQTPLKRIIEPKNSRISVISFWDGRDSSGNTMPDGNYVFVIYASLPSQNGFQFTFGGLNDRRIWTAQAKNGFLPISRGFVGISQIAPASTVIGSSPAIAGINPFFFRYSLSRDALVSMKIYDATGSRLVKTIIDNQVRPGLFGNLERWDEPFGDDGLVVDSGTYMVQLSAADPMFPAKVSTTTALFPVNLFRVTDVLTTPLLNGASDVILISYQLSQTMNVGINIYPPATIVTGSSATWPPCSSITPGGACGQVLTAGGTPAAPLVTIKGLRAGRLRITELWDGRDANGLMVQDGSYIFTLAAESTTTPKHFAVDRVVGSLTIQRGAIIFTHFSVDPDIPQTFNSSVTITSLPPFTMNYALTRQSSVTIQILNNLIPPSVVRTIVSGGFRDSNIQLHDVWDGRDDSGNFPPAGFYTVRAVAADLASQLSSGSTAQVTISFDPLRIYDVAVSPLRLDTRSASIFYQVSEPMKVAIKIYKAGTGFDPIGNPNPPENISLVKRIVGFKPARTQLEDVWDGTDLTLSKVPDGNYKFKILASTDSKAIDSNTGNVLNPTALSLDRPLDDIPVVRNASLDPAGDFEKNTFAYPNPVTGSNATFRIYNPFKARVLLRIYNIAGDLVLQQDFGEKAPSFSDPTPLEFVWNKTNQSGRGVARGIYYALVRIEETEGGKNILQTVKKVLLP